MKHQSQKPLSVLIVDDSSSIRACIRGIVESLGHRVVAEATNGLEAVESFVRYRPELVTLDIVMPVMDGITALEELHKTRMPLTVVMISSAVTHGNIQRAKEFGADVFIAKPVTVEKFLAALQELEQKGGWKRHG